MLNDFIKDEAREKFKGRAGRQILRNLAKKEIKKNKGKLESPLGKMRARQDRKDMAKALKIPFTPRYNGSVYKLKQSLEKNEKGYLIVKSELVEA